MSRNYQITNQPTVLQHHRRSLALLLRDSANLPPSRELDALAASGDCFVTLATALDAYLEQAAPAPEVEAVINDLLYLQRHYAITRKTAEFRQ